MFSTKLARTVGATLATTTLVLASAACGSDDSDPTEAATPETVDVTAAPEQVTWQTYQSIALPVSAVSGPKATTPAASEYELTPQGAALAAVNTSVRISTAPDDQWAAQVRASVAPGAGRDDFMVNRAQLSISSGQTQADALPHVRGYVVREYAEPNASVDIITSYSDGSVLSTTAQMLWRDGDWKLVLPNPDEALETQHALETVPDDITALEAP